MKALSMVAAAVAVVTFILSVILRIVNADLVAGTTSVTFWRVTVALLLFSIVGFLHSRRTE
ncbi:MAG: hypothetical protein JSV33_13060 [bacterium]|nr:MAG: hypothetical protein JSV33_13060 [bacterium]